MDSDYFHSPESADATRTQRSSVSDNDGEKETAGDAADSTIESLAAGHYRPRCCDEKIGSQAVRVERAGSMQNEFREIHGGAPCFIATAFAMVCSAFRILRPLRVVRPSLVSCALSHPCNDEKRSTSIPQMSCLSSVSIFARIALGKSQPSPVRGNSTTISFLEFRRCARRRCEERDNTMRACCKIATAAGAARSRGTIAMRSVSVIAVRRITL